MPRSVAMASQSTAYEPTAQRAATPRTRDVTIRADGGLRVVVGNGH